MSTLAYGWVERCNDVAGCGTSSIRLVFLTMSSLHLYLLVNEYDEHVVCLNECIFASTMYMKDYASYYVLCFKLFISALYACSCSWGYLPVCLVIVVSSSPI